MPEITGRCGAINLAAMLPRERNPSDLGPKLYIAQGAPDEMDRGDSTTPLHLDMTDAINVVVHQPPTSSKARAAAAWDIFSRRDLHRLREFLSEHDDSHAGEDPLFAKKFVLKQDDLDRLFLDRGVRPMRIEQEVGDAIMVPAGCAHQVRTHLRAAPASKSRHSVQRVLFF